MSTDQLPEMRPTPAPRLSRFRHEAMLYRGDEQFVERTAGFVRDALAAEEAVMVAVIEPRAGLLREELGADARLVDFIDMAAVGRNPARIIPAWERWVVRHRGAGRGFRGIGEPIWPGRSAAELIECQQHEALLNTAFDDGPPWWLMCPYDTSMLDSDVITRAYQTHPGVISEDRAYRSDSYPHPEYTRLAMFSAALPPGPTEPLYRIDFGLADLPRIRQAVASCATEQHVAARRVDDLVLVANELACNSIKHGGGAGTLSMWRDGEELVCEVRDSGVITDPLVGRRKPNPEGVGGAGLWIANLLCDLVQIRSTPQTGTAVRVHIDASDTARALSAESMSGDQSSTA
jgi:anti-sigma regulatory factor (Ser/Thr protein kinase)